MRAYMLRPNDAIIFEQNKAGYSFLCNASTGTGLFPALLLRQGGLTALVPVPSAGMTEDQIRAGHAKQLGIPEDRLRVLTDAYADKNTQMVKDIAAVFVKTGDLEGILHRNPELRALQM
ncbi:MAG TPA: hypothetical protein HA362_01140 [Nanoarchaeota archaeon]|nr:hypothetical protein [Nanoarchaeota archaeon]